MKTFKQIAIVACGVFSVIIFREWDRSKSAQGHASASKSHPKEVTLSESGNTKPDLNPKNSSSQQDHANPAGLHVKAAVDSRSQQLNRAYLSVESRFGRALLKLKGWSPDRIEALKRKLAEQDVAVMNASLPNQTPVTDAQRAATALGIQAMFTANQDELRQTMGDEDYTAFRSAVAMENYRPSVSSALNALRSNGLEISGSTEESVLAAYSQAVQEAASQNSSASIAGLSEDQISALKTEQDRTFNLALMRNVEAVLGDDQTQAFMAAIMER
jgi:hypothetical protein